MFQSLICSYGHSPMIVVDSDFQSETLSALPPNLISRTRIVEQVYRNRGCSEQDMGSNIMRFVIWYCTFGYPMSIMDAVIYIKKNAPDLWEKYQERLQTLLTFG